MNALRMFYYFYDTNCLMNILCKTVFLYCQIKATMLMLLLHLSDAI